MCGPWLGLKALALAWLGGALALAHPGQSPKPKPGPALAWLWPRPRLWGEIGVKCSKFEREVAAVKLITVCKFQYPSYHLFILCQCRLHPTETHHPTQVLLHHPLVGQGLCRLGLCQDPPALPREQTRERALERVGRVEFKKMIQIGVLVYFYSFISRD